MTKLTSRPRASSPPRSRLEWLLRWFGVNADLAEQVVGDLTEAHEECSTRFGAGAARWDYAQSLLRSVPHLGLSAIREGGPAERTRLALAVLGFTLVIWFSTAAAIGARRGPPARLFAEHSTASERIVVNHEEAVHLPMRVVDARERRLEDPIQYAWVSGAPHAVSPDGMITCAGNGDAVIRASAGGVESQVGVRCRPVSAVEAASWITLIDGGPAQELPFTAVGTGGRPVRELRGTLRIRDSSIATLSGAMVRPISPGETEVVVTVGSKSARIRVLVHERVNSFENLRPDQRLVAVPIRLARGDTVSLRLPTGPLWMKYLPKVPGEAPPTIISDIMCGPGDGLRVNRVPADEHSTYCLIMHTGAWVVLGHGFNGQPVVEGTLAIEIVERR